MATGNNQEFYIEALKALKLMGEKSPYGSDERKLYSTKANSLRDVLRKMGYANIDADYGANVALKDTPGGGKINWNVLANAADILGTSGTTSTRGAFDRALGEYLTRNLPVWQKQGATTPSSAVTSTTSSVMGGQSPASAVVSGTVGFGRNEGWKPQSAEATPASQSTATPNPWESAPSPDGTQPTGAGGGQPSPVSNNLYGSFIESEYFKNNDYDGYFISRIPNIPTITDPATGKKTIDWANPNMPGNMLTIYGNYMKLWNTAQGLSKEKLTFNAVDVEKNPAFQAQQKVWQLEMDSLIKQNNLQIEAQITGLKGSGEANKAALDYELKTIRREIGASNWRSRQSLAASGMAFSGMLGYLYGQNEAKGMDATIRATQISAAELKAIGQQIAILEGSKLSYASDLEALYGAKKASYLAQILDPSNKRWQEVTDLLNEAINGIETTLGVAPAELTTGQVAIQKAGEEATATAVSGYNEDQLKALKEGYRITSVSDDGVYTYTPILTGKDLANFVTKGYSFNEDGTLAGNYEPPLAEQATWLADGVYYDPETRTLSQVMTPKEVADFGIEGYSVDPNTGAILGYEPTPEQIANWLARGVVYDPKSKTFSRIVSEKSGGGDEEDVDVEYDSSADRAILSNAGASEAQKGRAALNLTAGTGAITDDNFISFMQGGKGYINENGEFILGKGYPTRGEYTPVNVLGVMMLSNVDAQSVIHLIKDPVRQAAASIIYMMKNISGDKATQWFDYMNAFIDGNADLYEFDSYEIADLEKMLIAYFGTKPGPGGSKYVGIPGKISEE